MSDIIPSEKLRVFISSAQSEEDTFDWLDFRKKVKKELQKCNYINPFIIEDFSNEIPSTQLFSYKVQCTDIMIFLFKNEYRNGTAIEFELARKLKKPILAYFCIDSDNAESEKPKKILRDNDTCTYKKLSSFKNAEKEIFNDIIQNVIIYYQYNHFLSDNDYDTIEVNLKESDSDDKYGIPTKTTISHFKSCYNTIFNYLDIPWLKNNETDDKKELSQLHNMGEDALKWLMTGENSFLEKNISLLNDLALEVFSNNEWLIDRWEAIKYVLDGDYIQALDFEKEALKKAKDSSMPTWIINDVLIDARNFQNTIDAMNGKFNYLNLNDFQTELDKSQSLVQLPVLDRYLKTAYGETLEEEIKINSALYGTKFFGTRIKVAILNIENYFFSALIYGSYVHMEMARNALANVLYKYGEITNDKKCTFEAIKLFLLSGETKKFKNILLSNWEALYSYIVIHADSLWLLINKNHREEYNTTKIALISKLGLYFSDNVFSESEEFLFNYSQNIRDNDVEEYLECVLSNIHRLNHENITNTLIYILNNSLYRNAHKISDIILGLNFSDISIETQTKLCASLINNIGNINRNNGDPQIIAVLIKANPSVFTVLETVPDNGLTGDEKLFYDVNMGNGNWIDILDHEINVACQQFRSYKANTLHIEFSINPYAIISNIINDHFESKYQNILNNSFFPHCEEILTSNIDVAIKDKCIKCLCTIFSNYKKHNITIPEKIISIIKNFSLIGNLYVDSLSSHNKETLGCRILMLKIILGISDKNELFQWCFSYSKKDDNERIALAECLKCYVEYSSDIDLMILSIVFQCCEDKLFKIRGIACTCLSFLLKSNYSDCVEEKIFEMATDESPYVISSLLNLCSTNMITNNSIKKRIIEIMQNDKNYVIREMALKIEL